MTTNQNEIAEAIQYLQNIKAQRLFDNMELPQRSEFSKQIRILNGNFKFSPKPDNLLDIVKRVLDLVNQYPDLQEQITKKGSDDGNHQSKTHENLPDLDYNQPDQIGNEVITLIRNLETSQNV